jgi:hypothetical protein
MIRPRPPRRVGAKILGPALPMACLLLLAAGPARADEPPRDPASVTPPSAPTPEQMAEARKEFEAGVSLLEDPDGAKYEEAYRAFKRAYSLSQSPKVLGNIAFCAMHLERDGEAIAAYTRYTKEVNDISERERAQIQRDLATMTATVAKVRVVVKEPAAKSYVLVDRRAQTRGPAIENVYTFEGPELLVSVHSGRHTLKVTSGDDAESTPVDLTLEPGTSVTQEVTVAKRVAPEQPVAVRASRVPVGPLVLGGVGVVALGVGVATGLLARSATNTLESNCPGDVCPPSYDLASQRTTAKRYGTIADFTLIGGGVLVAGAIVWFALSPRGASDAPARAARLAEQWWSPTAACGPTGCRLQLERGF